MHSIRMEISILGGGSTWESDGESKKSTMAESIVVVTSSSGTSITT